MNGTALAGLILLLNTIFLSSAAPVDLTLRRFSMGADVVRSVSTKIDDFNLFNSPSSLESERQAAELFLRESAFVESQDGTNFPLGIRDGGIWRISRDLFNRTQNYPYPQLFDDICQALCVNWMTVQYSDLAMPLYSGLAARIHLFHLYNTDQGLPEGATDTGRAVFWANAFGGNRVVSRWLSGVEQLRRVEVCQIDTDVLFVLDSSASIGPASYQTVRDYTYNYTEGLLSGGSNSRVGVILYSTTAEVEIPLDFVNTNGTESLLEEISNIRYIRQWTNTPEGLCLLKYMPWRSSISVLKLAIVFTDGRSNRFSRNCSTPDGAPGTVNSTAREVHNLNPPVTVLAIGVDNYLEEELVAIATSPVLVDELESFDYRLLLQNQRSRTYFICFQESQPVTMREEQTGEVGMGAVSRLEFTGPGNEEGLSIRICVDRGVIAVYGSYTSPNPNLALHDFSEVLTAPTGQVTPASCLTSYATLDDVNARRSEDEEACTACLNSLPGRRKRQTSVDVNVVIYITIEGASDTISQFNVNSEVGAAFDCVDSLCGTNAVLSRRDGRCFCECAPGYEGDGQNCSNVDECALGTHTCDENADCMDTLGNYTCTCREGYQKNSQICTNINECALKTDTCGENEECLDTPGNYTCTCTDGYIRNGKMCTRLEEEFFKAHVYVIVVGALCAVALVILTVTLIFTLIISVSARADNKKSYL